MRRHAVDDGRHVAIGRYRPGLWVAAPCLLCTARCCFRARIPLPADVLTVYSNASAVRGHAPPTSCQCLANVLSMSYQCLAMGPWLHWCMELEVDRGEQVPRVPSPEPSIVPTRVVPPSLNQKWVVPPMTASFHSKVAVVGMFTPLRLNNVN